ncbi:AAA family ATPase, partial [Mycobacterium tuberculosis]|nr:AAA family ATPase [Mycobacterium tuberculosis]
WQWDQSYPVIRISFDGGIEGYDDLSLALSDVLTALEEKWYITNSLKTISGRFQALIQHCHQTTGQKVVILIDEYDKPILDSLQ